MITFLPLYNMARRINTRNIKKLLSGHDVAVPHHVLLPCRWRWGLRWTYHPVTKTKQNKTKQNTDKRNQNQQKIAETETMLVTCQRALKAC